MAKARSRYRPQVPQPVGQRPFMRLGQQAIEFAERVPITFATESAADGVNLQFCSLVVSYDLPWNPQRIEQRFGRYRLQPLQGKERAKDLEADFHLRPGHPLAQDEMEQRKEAFIGHVEARLQQRTSRQHIFTVRWRVR